MSVNSEEAVLGACLVDPQCFWAVADLLSPADFSQRALARLYAAMTERARRSEDFDAVTLMDDAPELGDLAMTLASAEGWRKSNVRAYAQRVVEAAVMRRVRHAGQQIAHLDGEDILGQAQRLLAACGAQAAGGIKHIRQLVTDSYADLLRKYQQEGELIGVPTGLEALDDLTGGFQASDMIVLAARPSVGKTAFALTMAHAAAKAERNVLVFSLEMSGKQLTDRAISSEGCLDGSIIRNPKLMQEESWPRLTNGMAIVRDLPIYVCDESALTVEAIGARARQQHAQTPLGLIVIDYLTLIVPPKANTTSDAVQIISRSLKALAKELNVPLVVLSQLNREGEGHRPTMKTLRDSGAIEQDADVIMFLHRPNAQDRSTLELIVEKQRNGPTGDLTLHADMAHMRFSVIEAREPDRKVSGLANYKQRGADRRWED